ncbi:MAG: hypothetical protein H8E55_68005 [Pelagibacterales bacterium]|nr:hypothetical protein [Pelagibacterales bacterium]
MLDLIDFFQAINMQEQWEWIDSNEMEIKQWSIDKKNVERFGEFSKLYGFLSSHPILAKHPASKMLRDKIMEGVKDVHDVVDLQRTYLHDLFQKNIPEPDYKGGTYDSKKKTYEGGGVATQAELLEIQTDLIGYMEQLYTAEDSEKKDAITGFLTHITTNNTLVGVYEFVSYMKYLKYKKCKKEADDFSSILTILHDCATTYPEQTGISKYSCFPGFENRILVLAQAFFMSENPAVNKPDFASMMENYISNCVTFYISKGSYTENFQMEFLRACKEIFEGSPTLTELSFTDANKDKISEIIKNKIQEKVGVDIPLAALGITDEWLKKQIETISIYAPSIDKVGIQKDVSDLCTGKYQPTIDSCEEKIEEYADKIKSKHELEVEKKELEGGIKQILQTTNEIKVIDYAKWETYLEIRLIMDKTDSEREKLETDLSLQLLSKDETEDYATLAYERWKDWFDTGKLNKLNEIDDEEIMQAFKNLKSNIPLLELKETFVKMSSLEEVYSMYSSDNHDKLGELCAITNPFDKAKFLRNLNEKFKKISELKERIEKFQSLSDQEKEGYQDSLVKLDEEMRGYIGQVDAIKSNSLEDIFTKYDEELTNELSGFFTTGVRSLCEQVPDDEREKYQPTLYLPSDAYKEMQIDGK